MFESSWKRIDRDKNEDTIKKLMETYRINELQATILVNRNLSKEDMDKFFNYDINNLNNPALLPNAEKAINILKETVNKKEEIIIYGDYDVDGVSSVVIGQLLLNPLTKTNYYINNRFVQGYGLAKSGIDEILETYPNTKLILTADNGITAFETVAYAKEKGLKVIITDHHDPIDKLPLADAIVNPKLKDNKYPFAELCGAAVLWKLLMLLYWELDLDLVPVYDLIDIVAMATVADVVPVVDENRLICKLGLKKMTERSRLAFKLLLERAHSNDYPEQTIGFQIAPMINALGRLKGDCSKAVEIFLLEDEFEILNRIDYLTEMNEMRKELTKEQVLLAEELLEEKINKIGKLPNVIMLHHDSFHEGIVGLIAGQLKEKYHRPTIIFTTNKTNNNIIKGSARSIEGFNIKPTFDIFTEHIVGHGGHNMAAGLSIELDKFNEFDKLINDYSEEIMTNEIKQKTIYLDDVLNCGDITEELIDDLKFLSPFGAGFPFPNLALKLNWEKKFKLKDVHLKLSQENLSVLLWNKYEEFETKNFPKSIYCLGTPQTNIYRGQVQMNFTCNDYKVI